LDHFIENILDFADRATTTSSASELLANFATVARECGFNHFIMTGLPAYGEDVERLILGNGWPAGWIDRYREGSYFFHDPVSRQALSTSQKYTWAEARRAHPQTRITKQIEDEAAQLSMRDGIAFPMFDAHNWQAVVSLSADHELDLPNRLKNMVYVSAVVCHGRAAQLLDSSSTAAPHLSPREREVLTWMAAGKTRGEVGDILGISENTVKSQLASAGQKLGVANTMQAIARAMQHRLLQL
jgi:LuxR family quorum sensing-dependent transcriptional regulator